jgi:hypothetical protein
MCDLYITSLPREILLCIFQCIPPQDICANAARVSKAFNDLAEEPVLWKYFCEAEFQVDGKLMNNLVNVRWHYEYILMKTEWENVTLHNGLRVVDSYKEYAAVDNDSEDGPVFENLRAVANNDRPPPITAQGIQPIRPLPLGDFTIGYYELRLDDLGAEQILGLGLARNNYVEAMPGWRKGSIGVHADDGKIFNGCGFGSPLTIPWILGDIVGCGIDFLRRRAIFTRNGVLLGSYALRQTEGLYATVGSRTLGERVTVNFGKKPFVFDIIQYQKELREADEFTPLYPVVYSSIVKSKFVSELPPDYDEEDDYDDEDNEFDDKHMNKTVQYFNSVLRVLQNVEEYSNEDGLVLNLVALLRPQLIPEDNSDTAEARQTLAFRIVFNKQSALLAHFMRAHEEGLYNASPPTSTSSADVLPRDDFPKAELVRCIAVLLSDEFRDDNPLVLNTVYRGRELFGFQPPQGMTIAQERGQLALALSREIQGHERERRSARREAMRKLREIAAAQRRIEDKLAQTYTEDEYPPLTHDKAVGTDEAMDVVNSDPSATNPGAEEAGTINVFDAVTTQVEELPNAPDSNTDNSLPDAPMTEAPNNDNTTNDTEPVADSMDHEDFQKLLATFIALLSDENIPDTDYRITSAIIQWYSTLDIELKPEMEVSGERKRLASILLHLGQRVRDQAENCHNISGGSGLLTRLWMWAGGGGVTGSRLMTLFAVVGAAFLGFKKLKWRR